MNKLDSIPLRELPEPVKGPFLTLEDKEYCEYYVKRWNDIAQTLPDRVGGGEQKWWNKVFEIDEKRVIMSGLT